MKEQKEINDNLNESIFERAKDSLRQKRIKKGKWISVDYELPKKGQKVLTYTPKTDTTIEEQRIIIFGSAPKGFPDGVKFWMTLPDNP